MGKYQDIVTLIEQSVPDYTSLKVVPRGTPVFQDLLMTGEARFARRIGANFAVLNPDNQFELVQDVTADQTVLQVNQILPWLEAGALITFNRTEMMEVVTWAPESNSVFVKDPLSTPRPAETKVDLWAVPLVMHFQSDEGQNKLFVRSRYQIANGDAITFPQSESLNSLKEIDVVEAYFAGTQTDPDYPYIYQLTLKENLPVTLTMLNRVYLRAFPSYVSRVLRVPKLRQGQMGPFLLDFVASPLDATAKYDETFAIRTFASGDQAVEGGTNSFKTVGHNHPVVNRPIFAENMIFWKMIRGYGGFNMPNRFRMVANSEIEYQEDGQTKQGYVARISSKMVPGLNAGIRYDFRVKANTAGLFIVIPYPYPAIKVECPISADTVVSVVTPAGGPPIKRMDFIFRTSRPDTEVTISDAALPVNPVVQSFQYSYVFRVLGTSNFQATSIIVKPYFLSLSDLTARYTDGKTYNSGFIYL